MSLAGETSTASKRPTLWFGPEPLADLPRALRWSRGARVGDTQGREYLDFGMALGAVTLGYGHPEVTEAAVGAIEQGGVGPLPPEIEGQLAADLVRLIPWMPAVRFLKTGAEAVAAAIRLSRVHTGREHVIGCGYHGWLDGTSRELGVPAATQARFSTIPFNDADAARRTIKEGANDLALVIVEPVVDTAPNPEWLATLRTETEQVGALLAFDEIKTGFRLGPGGGAERWGVTPDLTVLGKGLANGFPLAAVGGRRDVMGGVERTWISSTLATEAVALAAARTTTAVFVRDQVASHLGRVGAHLHSGLAVLAAEFPDLVAAAPGIAEMCYLRYHSDSIGTAVTRAAARRGLLFKRTAYDFVSLAHSTDDVDRALDILRECLNEVRR